MLNENGKQVKMFFGRLLGIGPIHQAYYQVKEMSLPWIECKLQCNCCYIFGTFQMICIIMARCSVYAISEE